MMKLMVVQMQLSDATCMIDLMRVLEELVYSGKFPINGLHVCRISLVGPPLAMQMAKFGTVTNTVGTPVPRIAIAPTFFCFVLAPSQI